MSEIGRITVYNPSMAKKCAEMFNAFNEIWPGGFTGGIPYDERRVHDFLDKTSAIADLIALDSEEEPVGYCGLYPHWRDKNAAYISILGVHPRVQGMKFGKRLLLRALEEAEKKGIFRVDLHTWSGNMEAVPLYKKIGLFWVPETSVYMQDFIPGILQNPLAKEWFSKHPNWYSCFKRVIDQVPDTEVVEGMEVFTYIFEVEEDKLKIEVDRYGWGFIGIERTLDGETISIKSRLQSHKIFMGIENTLSFTIKNDSKNDLEIKLSVNPFKGLKWSGEFPPLIKVEKGGNVTISNNFIIDFTSRKHRSLQRSSEVIESNFSFGSYKFKFVTGGKIHPAVDLFSYSEYIDTPIGIEKKVNVDLKNYTSEPLSGKLIIDVEGIKTKKEEREFSIQPEEIIGLEFPLLIPKDKQQSVFYLQITPVVKIKNSEFPMPMFKLPIVVNSPNVSEVVQSPSGDTIYLITDFWAIQVDLERANIYFRRRYVEDNKIRSLFEIGPPYGMDLDRTLRFEYKIKKDGKELTLILSADSLQVKGLRIKKYLHVTPGIKEVEHWIELENIGSQGIITKGGRITTITRGGINANPFGNFSRVITPIYYRYVECDPTFPVLTQTLVSDNPNDWHESWTAGELIGESNISAVIWKPSNIEKIKIEQGFLYSLESTQTPLNTGKKVEVIHLWYCHSFNSIRDVRIRWNQLVGQKEMKFEESTFGIKTTSPLTAKLQDSNIMIKGKKQSAVIDLFSLSSYPLPGMLTLVLPEKWKGSFLTSKGKQSQIKMPELTPLTNTKINVELVVPEYSQKSSDLIKLHFSGEFEIDLNIPILLKGTSEISVQDEKIDGYDVFTISNGNLCFMVPKNIGGNLIRIEDSNSNSFLLDSLPEIGPKFFISHYLGGIQPTVFHPSEGNPFTELEKTRTEMISEGQWSGVKAYWINEKSEWLKGQKYSVSYLTLPDSNIIRIKLENINETPRKVTSIASMVADVALKGDTTDNVIKVPGSIGNWTRNRIEKPFINQANIDKPWIRITKDDTSITFLSPLGYYGSNTIYDANVMLLNFLISFMETEPYQISSNEFVILINQPEEAIEEVRRGLAKNYNRK